MYTSGTTAKPKGIAHTTAGYLVGAVSTHHYVHDVKPDADVYWCAADVGWITGHSYIVYGPLAQRDDRSPVRGHARLPGQGPLVGDRRAVRRDDPLHGADRDPRAHEVGDGVRRAARPLVVAAARLGRRADQPGGLDLVPAAHRRRSDAGRRHVVADGDGDGDDHAAAGRDHAEAGLGDEAVPGSRRRGRRRVGQRGRTRGRRLPGPAQALAGDAARHLQRPRPVRGDVLVAVPGHVLRGGRCAARPRRRLLAPRAGGRRDERVRAPDLDDRGRVGAGRPPRCGRGGSVRPERRADRTGDRRVRDPEGRRRRRRSR